MAAAKSGARKTSPKSTVDEAEIRHFSKDSAHWWDENGPFKPLHRAGPVRLKYIKAQICRHFGRDELALNALEGLKILDVGCGGGLVCEPLSRLGAEMTGLDADANAIEAAKTHAAQNGLSIDYRCMDAVDLNEKFDVVLALEIIEHVPDPAAFIDMIADKVAPGGLVIFSTLNRTAKSFALGIVGLEYVLRWVPRGTHDWKKFVRPSEIARAARANGLAPGNVCGLAYNPLKGEFALSQTDTDVNYFLTCAAPQTKPAGRKRKRKA